MARGIYGLLFLFLALPIHAAKPGSHESHDKVKPAAVARHAVAQPQQLVQTEAAGAAEGGEDDASMDVLTDSIKSLFGSDAQAPPMPNATPAAASAPAKTVKTAAAAPAAKPAQQQAPATTPKPALAAAAPAAIKAVAEKKPEAATKPEAAKAPKPAAAAAAKKPVAAVETKVAASKPVAQKKPVVAAAAKKPVSKLAAAASAKKPVVAAAAKKPVAAASSKKPVVAAAAKKPVATAAAKKPVAAASSKKPVAKPVVAAAAKKPESKPASKPVVAAAAKKPESKPAAKPVVAAVAKKPETKPVEKAAPATPTAAPKVAAAAEVKASPTVAPKAAVGMPAVKAVKAEANKTEAVAPANATKPAANKTEVPKAARLTMGVSGHLAAAPPSVLPTTNKTAKAAKAQNATAPAKKEAVLKKDDVEDLPMAKLFVDDDPTPAPPAVTTNATTATSPANATTAKSAAPTEAKITKEEKNLTSVNTTAITTAAVSVKAAAKTAAAASANASEVKTATKSTAAQADAKLSHEQELEAEVAALKAKLAAEEVAKASKAHAAAPKKAVSHAPAHKAAAPKPHQEVHHARPAAKTAAHRAPEPVHEPVHHAKPPTHALAHAPEHHGLDPEERAMFHKMLQPHHKDSPLKKFLKSLSDDDRHSRRQSTARPHEFNYDSYERHTHESGLIKLDASVATAPKDVPTATAAPAATVAPAAAAPVEAAPAAEEAAPEQTSFLGRWFGPIGSFFSWMMGSKPTVAVHAAGRSQLSLIAEPKPQPKQDPTLTAWQTKDAKMRLVEISDEWGRREMMDEEQVEHIKDRDHTERVFAETKASPMKVVPKGNGGESHATSFWSTLEGQDAEIESSLKKDSLARYQQLSKMQDEQVKHAVSISDREALKMSMHPKAANAAESKMIHDDWSEAESQDKAEEEQIHDNPDLQMIQKGHFRKRAKMV